MQISFDSTDLINEVRQNILLEGGNTLVFAVYSYRPDYEYISDYVFADKPARDEWTSDSEYQQVLNDYQRGLDSLKETKHVKMTLKKLLDLLLKQNKTL